MSALTDLVSEPPLRRAFVESVITGVVGGVVGVRVVLRKLSFATMALTHATLPGVVIAALLGINLLIGSAIFGLLVVLAIALATHRSDLDESSGTGVILVGGLGLGVLLASAQSGFTKNLTAYLVGSVLTVSTTDIWVTAAIGLLAIGTVTALATPLTITAFDPDGAEASGMPTWVIDAILLGVVQITLVATVPTVGVVLSVAMLVAPAAAARMWTDRIPTATALAAALGALCGPVGLLLSRRYDVAAGATIALVAGAVFALSAIAAPLLRSVCASPA